MDAEKDFIAAIKAGDVEKVKGLLAQDSSLVELKPAEAPTVILMAVYYGQKDLAGLLAQYKRELDVFEAVVLGKLDLVKNAMEKGSAEVNDYSKDGFQPLGLASFFGQEQIAHYLLERGAEVNSYSHNSLHVMPLHSAVASQNLAIAKMLLERGAQVNARQEGDFVPLHSAAQNGQMEMISLLLIHGAQVNLKNAQGVTPLGMAQKTGHTSVVDLLRKQGGAE